MFTAQRNQGLYYELTLLIDYIEDDHDLNLLNELLIDFRTQGLTSHDIKLSIELIEEYLPEYIECDGKGCYFNQDIDSMPAHTYFSDLETEHQETKVNTLVFI